MRLGMVGCELCSHTTSARLVMPDELATLGAAGSEDTFSPASDRVTFRHFFCVADIQHSSSG